MLRSLMSSFSKFNIPIRNFGRKKRKNKNKERRKRRIKSKTERAPIYKYVYDPLSAFKMLQVHSYASFDENLHLYIRLGTDPKRSEFNVRGSCYLPNGNGKSVKIGFVPGNSEEKQLAIEAKADVIIEEKDFTDIQRGVFKFDKLYSTNEGVKLLKPLARILGPKGLFPNKKVSFFYKFVAF